MQKKKRDWAKLSARLASLASELKNSPPPPPRRRKRRSPSKIPKYNPQKQQHPQHQHHHHQRTTPRQNRTTNNATSSSNHQTPSSQQGTSRLSQVREKSIRSKLRAAAYTIGGINWYKLFKHYDRDNSGALDYDEFRRAVRRDAKLTVSQLPDSDLRWLFRQIDVDGGGSVEIEEFTNYLEEKNTGNVASTVKKNSTATSTRRQRKRKEGNYGTTSTPPPSRIPRSDYGRKNHTNTNSSKLQYQNRSSSSTTTGTGGTSIRRRKGGNEEKKSKKERTLTHVSQNSVASSRRHQMTPVREKEIRSRLRRNKKN